LDYKNIIYEKEGNVATITLNRPKALNAMTYEMVQEIIDAVHQMALDGEVRAAVITGAGRGFCAGDDLKGGVYPPGIPAIECMRQEHVMIKAIMNLRKPVIAAVNGNAHGTGSDIMLACDFRIASGDAKLGDLRTRNGIVILSGATYLLQRIVGLSKAIELLFTGDMIDAEEAERIGLVNKTVPVDTFKAEVTELADRLAQGPTAVIGRAKGQIYRELNMDLSQALEDELIEMGMRIEDSEEGEKAFLEKRPARFTGR